MKVNLDKKLSSSYEIRIGYKIIDRMALIIAKNFQAGRYVMITDNSVGSIYTKQMMDSLKDVGLNINLIEFPAGESSKNVNTVLDIVGKLLELGADRSTILIALGGGVVGDLVGFIASIYTDYVDRAGGQQHRRKNSHRSAAWEKPGGHILSAARCLCGFSFSGNPAPKRV
jgi:3-dehydroquinate synthase